MEQGAFLSALEGHEQLIATVLRDQSLVSPLGARTHVRGEVISQVERAFPFYNAVASYERDFKMQDEHAGELIQIEEIALYRQLLILWSSVKQAYNTLYNETVGLTLENTLDIIMRGIRLDSNTELAISRMASSFALYEFGDRVKVDSSKVLAWAETFASFLREQTLSGRVQEYKPIATPHWANSQIWRPNLRILFKAYQVAQTQHVYVKS